MTCTGNSGRPRLRKSALTEWAMSSSLSTRVPSRSKIRSLMRSLGIGRITRIISFSVYPWTVRRADGADWKVERIQYEYDWDIASKLQFAMAGTTRRNGWRAGLKFE